MNRTLTLIAALLLMPWPALAERPPTGLLTKNDPLPATIPLQVRAPKGADYAILLDTPDGAPVISGYLRGGDVLRLLVPPGDHRVTVAAGDPQDWRGIPTLFDGDRTTLPDPLTFRIDGARREGQAITLTQTDDGLRITDQQNRTLCQIADWDVARITETTPLGTHLRYLQPQLSVRNRPCD